MASSSRPARARYLSSIVPTSLIPEKSGNHSECSSYFCWGPYGHFCTKVPLSEIERHTSHDRCWRSVEHLARPPIATGPVRAAAAGRSLVVAALLVRAANDLVSQGNSLDDGCVEERQDLGGDLWIRPHIAVIGQPPPQVSRFLFGGQDEGDRYFRCHAIVRAIESDRCHRKSAKAPPGLLAEPLDGLSFEHRSVSRATSVIDRSIGRDSGRRRLSLPGFSIPWAAVPFVPRRLDRIGPTRSGSFRRDRASAIAEFVHHRSPQESNGKTFPVKGRRVVNFDLAADADSTTVGVPPDQIPRSVA